MNKKNLILKLVGVVILFAGLVVAMLWKQYLISQIIISVGIVLVIADKVISMIEKQKQEQSYTAELTFISVFGIFLIALWVM